MWVVNIKEINGYYREYSQNKWWIDVAINLPAKHDEAGY